MSIYLKLPDIHGSVSSKNYQGWIKLIDLENAITRKADMQVGRMDDRENSRPTFHEMTLSKAMDKSSPELLKAVCTGDTLSKAEIHLCDSQGAHTKYVLSDVIITERQIISNGEHHPIENLSFSYSKFVETYTPRDNSNKPSSPFSSGYDLEKAALL